MALTCPLDLDVVGLRSEAQTMYSRVAAAPDDALRDIDLWTG
jgi:hypothetical protein